MAFYHFSIILIHFLLDSFSRFPTLVFYILWKPLIWLLLALNWLVAMWWGIWVWRISKQIAHSFTYVYMCVFVCVWLYVCMYVHVSMYICIFVYVYVYIHVHIHIYIYICIYIYMYIYVYIYIYICICIYVYIYVSFLFDFYLDVAPAREMIFKQCIVM